MSEPTCKECSHFHQHYALDQYRAYALACGHCSFPGLKHRQPNKGACKHFAKRSKPPELPDREEVIHFLTKEILQHILDLEIPPELEEQP